MEELEPVGSAPRIRRAVALIGLALTVLVAGAAVYLWSSPPHGYRGPPPAASTPIPVSMDWRSATQGWIIVHDGGGPESTLFHTSDGGAHWQRQLSIEGPASVRFADSRHGTLQVEGLQRAEPRVLRTDDGGTSWRSITLPELDPGMVGRAFFLDGDTGWVLGLRYAQPGVTTSGTLLYGTVDGGLHWQRLVDARQGGPASGGISGADDVIQLAFIADGTGWLTGNASTGPPPLFMTRDGGRSWVREALPAGVPGPSPTDHLEIGAPTVSGGGSGVLPVYDRDAEQTWLYVTDDGGASWHDPRPLPQGGDARRPSFADGSAGWTWNTSAAWSTADGGRSWHPAAGLAGGWLFGTIVPVSGTEAWVDGLLVREQAAQRPASWGLFRTSDAGRRWTRSPLPSLA
jgi:photosystem II stability/assembly factor-like uncharacterized protein